MNSNKKIAPRAATPETERKNNCTTNSITENIGKIKVVLQRPGEISRIVTVLNTLETLQDMIGGYIEMHSLSNGLVLVMDEEGRLKGLPENVRCVQYGTIVGTVFITAADDEGELISLTPEQCQSARAWLLKHSV